MNCIKCDFILKEAKNPNMVVSPSKYKPKIKFDEITQ